MTAAFSLYLDLVRITAAFLVLIAHTNLRHLSDDVPFASGFGHSAVVVFFVLSGFVISYVVDHRERSARLYAVSRISRIYSVLLPALLLALALDSIGQRLAADVYAGQTSHGWSGLRFLATMCLMNEPWGISIQAFSAPFWSVSYEGWYYILFGVFTFWTGRGRVLAHVVALLLCGPKILLLLPIWLGGVYLHRGRLWAGLRPRPAVLLFCMSLLAIGVYHWIDGPAVLRLVVQRIFGEEFQLQRMTWSGEFIGDYLLGGLMMLNFASFRAAGPALAWIVEPIAGPIRWAASFTFSLYLYHRPLLLFYIACLRGDVTSYTFYFEVLGLTLISVYLLARVTEHRKAWFRARAERLVDWMARLIEGRSRVAVA